MSNDTCLALGYIGGFFTISIVWLISYLDKKSEINKKVVKQIEKEIKQLGELSDEDFYYKYFNEIGKAITKPTSATLKIETGFYRESYYQIVLSGGLFSSTRSIEFNPKNDTKDDLKKIIDRALKGQEGR